MAKIVESRWEQYFAEDIHTKIKYSNKEYVEYKKTLRIIHLQQACNKLFSAVENFMMLKYHKRVKSYVQVVALVKGNRNDRELLAKAVQLHYFYYNAELQMAKEDAEVIYLEVKRLINNRVR